jgi:gliding motility-associatede transport system auxiliary component
MNKHLVSRVLGALGLVLVLSTVVTLFFGNAQLVGAKLLLGLLGIAASFAMGESGGVKRFFTGRALHFGAVTAVSALLLVVLLGVANWAAAKRPKTWDLTKDRLFTLQDDTLKTLRNLKTDVKAIAVYRLDEEGYGPAQDLLKRYAALSPRFSYEMVDPYKAPDKAKLYGITSEGPRILLLAGSQRAPASFPDEQGVTNALVKVTRSSSRKVYFTTGHGEPDPMNAADQHGYSKIKAALEGEGYEVATLSLLEKPEVPTDAAVVLAAGARTGFLDSERKALDAYAARGGHLGLFLEPDADPGFDAVLKGFGVQADDDIVVDVSPASQAIGSVLAPVVFPTANHPISRDLTGTALIFVTSRSLAPLTGAGATPTPLALTGQEAWGETDVKGVSKGQVKKDEGEKVGPLPVAMASERPVAADEEKEKVSDRARLVVAGDSHFFTNDYLQLGGNRDFVMNAVGWLAEQEDRITIRPKSREASQVLLTDAQATALKFVTVDVLPVALLGLGLAVWVVRRSR